MDILGFEKLIYHYEKIQALARDEPQFPVLATLSLGNYCNHRCLWCTAYEYQQSKAKIMDPEAILDWLTRAAGAGLKAVGYVGNGEPTAYPQFDRVARTVAELGLQQGMFTNGYLLNRFEDTVLDHFTYVRVSLDAGSPDMHARMHDVRPTHFPAIMDNLRALVAKRRGRKPTLGIQYAVHHQNIDDMHAAAALAADVGVDYFSIKPVFNRGSVGERIEKNALTLAQVSAVAAGIRRDFESPAFQVHFRPFQVLSEEADRNVLPYDRCVAGFFNLNVYEDGALVYCGPHRVRVGSLADDLKVVQQRCLALSKEIDLSKCPGGCRYHAMNHLVHTVLHPEAADEYHINFL